MSYPAKLLKWIEKEIESNWNMALSEKRGTKSKEFHWLYLGKIDELNELKKKVSAGDFE